jgi:hypothetical protein
VHRPVSLISGLFTRGEADERSDLAGMVIGEVELGPLTELISNVEQPLNRPVNDVAFSEREWDEKLAHQEPFATNVTRSPKLHLIGGEHAIRAPA